MSEKALKLFFSYSHKDETLRDRLAVHLSNFERQGLIHPWHDRAITAGQEWAESIDAHLEAADLILLLISPDFIASDYCWGVEMKRALERHKAGTARVVPIFLRPTEWSRAPFSKLQALPRDAKPITKWANRDEAFLNVTQGLSRMITELQVEITGRGATASPSSPPATIPSVSDPPSQTSLPEASLLEELASVFSSEAAAFSLLDEAGIPTTRIRPFGLVTPIQFWKSVFRELEQGLTKEGLDGLVHAALRQYPHNKVFLRWVR